MVSSRRRLDCLAPLTFDGAGRRQLEHAGIEFSGLLRRTSGVSDHADAKYVGGTAGANGRVGGSLWRLSASGNWRTNEDPGALALDLAEWNPGAADPLARFDESQRHGLATAVTLQSAARAWSHQERFYVNTRVEDGTRTILLAPAVGDRQRRALSTTAIGGSAEGERRLGSAAGAGVVRFGVDVSREFLETSYRPVGEDGMVGAAGPSVAGHRDRAGIFVSSGWSPAARLRLSGAMRWDHVNDDAFTRPADATDHAWSPRFGVTVGLSETRPASLFAQVSTAFKVPTLNQLFDPRPYPDFSGGAFTISNRRLVPQRATAAEAGIQGGGPNLHWGALVYRMHVHHEIDFDARTFSYGNIGESRHSGVELELDGRVWRRLQPSVRYAWTQVGDENGDRQLKNVPRHSLTLAANVDFAVRPRHRSKLSAAKRRVSRRCQRIRHCGSFDGRPARPPRARPASGVRRCAQPDERSLRGIRVHARRFSWRRGALWLSRQPAGGACGIDGPVLAGLRLENDLGPAVARVRGANALPSGSSVGFSRVLFGNGLCASFHSTWPSAD